MGCNHYLICTHMHHHFSIFVLILVISTTSHLTLFTAQGRKLAQRPNYLKEEKATWRVQIGSKPPRCERRCDSCGHCEAIQVPTNQHTMNSNSTSIGINGRDYGSSNYKPMSWKCKCGNLFFNP